MTVYQEEYLQDLDDDDIIDKETSPETYSLDQKV